MTTAPIYQVAAFATGASRGNPAAVIALNAPLTAASMQSVAADVGQPATAFLLRENSAWSIRWFTPTVQLPLCGHATLAAAWVLFNRMAPAERGITFVNEKAGTLVAASEGRRIWLDFPSAPATASLSATAAINEALGAQCVAVLETEANYLAVLESAAVVRALTPNINAISQLDRSGVIVTARGDNGFDCVSRYFAPKKGVGEDAVTGSAHCSLVPYWSGILGKTRIRACQASARGGELECEYSGASVRISGDCTPILEGTINVADG